MDGPIEMENNGAEEKWILSLGKPLNRPKHIGSSE